MDGIYIMKKKALSIFLVFALVISMCIPVSAIQTSLQVDKNRQTVEFYVLDSASNDEERHYSFSQTVYVDDNGNVYSDKAQFKVNSDETQSRVNMYALSLEFKVTWKGSYLKDMSWGVVSSQPNLKYVTGDVDIFADYSMVEHTYFHSDPLAGMSACYGPIDGTWYIPSAEKVEIQVLWNIDTITQHHAKFESYFPVHK